MITTIKSYLRQIDIRKVSTLVSHEYEITEIANRVNFALLFKNIDGYDIPVLVNFFKSFSFKQFSVDLEFELFFGTNRSVHNLFKLNLFSKILKFKNVIFPRVCENKFKASIYDLDDIPILKHYPLNAGQYITAGVVVTKNQNDDSINYGIYRLQKLDACKLVVHWQLHKHGARNYINWNFKKEERMPVYIAIGVDPHFFISASLPLPIPEYIFAFLISKKPLSLFRFDNKMLIPPAEIILKGYVTKEKVKEGPFADHTGYYSTSLSLFPVFYLEEIYMNRAPIYQDINVGGITTEDCNLGRIAEFILNKLIKYIFKEIKEIHFPAYGLFRNVMIIKIRKEYPKHAKKVMFGIWGMDQLCFTKFIIVVDEDIDIRDKNQVLWAISTRVDPEKDIIIIKDYIADTLDFASKEENIGSKVGVDATLKKDVKKVKQSDDIVKLVNKRWNEYGI